MWYPPFQSIRSGIGLRIDRGGQRAAKSLEVLDSTSIYWSKGKIDLAVFTAAP